MSQGGASRVQRRGGSETTPPEPARTPVVPPKSQGPRRANAVGPYFRVICAVRGRKPRPVLGSCSSPCHRGPVGPEDARKTNLSAATLLVPPAVKRAPPTVEFAQPAVGSLFAHGQPPMPRQIGHVIRFVPGRLNTSKAFRSSPRASAVPSRRVASPGLSAGIRVAGYGLNPPSPANRRSPQHAPHSANGPRIRSLRRQLRVNPGFDARVLRCSSAADL